MKKLLGTIMLSLSLTAAGTAMAAETLAINEDFTNYQSQDGKTVPAGWIASGNALDGTDTGFKQITDGRNSYIQLFATGNTHKKVRLQKKEFDSPVARDYVLNFRFMTEYEGVSFLETKFIETNSGQIMYLKGSGAFSPLTGTSNYDASAVENGGTMIKYAPGNWYDITVVSRDEGNDNIRFSTYVDGVMRDNALAGIEREGLSRGNLSLVQLGFDIPMSNAASNIELNLDDIKLYTSYNDLDIASGTISDGDKNVDTAQDLEFYFNNDILPKSLESITVSDSDGAITPVSVTRLPKTMKGIKLHFDALPEPGTEYTIDFSNVTDLLGGKMSDGAFRFTTKDILLGTEITYCDFESGTIEAAVKYTNPAYKKPASAKSLIAVYNSSGALCALELSDIELAAGASESRNISIGNGRLERGCTLKVICLKDFESLRPAADAAVQKYIGKAITLPSDFAELPFEIYRNGAKSYSHNASPSKFFSETNALNIYISSNKTDMYGYTPDKPTDIEQFAANIENNIYSGYSDFIINFVDEVMTDPVILNLEKLNISSIMFKSASPSKKTWLGKKAEISDWIQYDENTYKTTLSSDETVLFPVSLNVTDSHGMPKPYDIKTSLEECTLSHGSCFIDGRDVYVNPFEDENISNIDVIIKERMLHFSNWTNQTVIIDSLGFLGEQYRFEPSSTDAKLYIFNSKFYRGEVNAFYVMGSYTAYIFDSVAAYASADGFNYHSKTRESMAAEINCISYGNGKYKLKTPSSQTSTGSNNGSTAHDSMKILRIGGKYWECEGAIVIDINNCYSINIGCEARTILDTTTGNRAGFAFSNDVGGNDFNETDQKKYVIDCTAGGDNLDRGGFRYESNVLNTPVIGLDIDGTTPSDRPLSFTITWDDIMNGNW